MGTRITRAGRATIAVVALGIAFVLGAVVLGTATTSLPGPIDLAAVPDPDAARGEDVGFRLVDGAGATSFGDTGGSGTSIAEARGPELSGPDPTTGGGVPASAPGGATTTTRPSRPPRTPSPIPTIGTPTTPSPTIALPSVPTDPLPTTPTVTVPDVSLPPVTIPGVDPTTVPTISVPVITVPAVTLPTTPPLPTVSVPSPFGA